MSEKSFEKARLMSLDRLRRQLSQMLESEKYRPRFIINFRSYSILDIIAEIEEGTEVGRTFVIDEVKRSGTVMSDDNEKQLKRASEKVDQKIEEQEPVQLRVGDARQRDIGRGIARIDQRTMQRLGISAGDVIEVINKRTTSAIAWPAYGEDQNRDIIRIDGFTRKNSGVAVNEYVVVRPAKVKTALSITLAPVDMRLNVTDDFTNFVKNRLMELTLVEGDTTLIMMLGHAIPFTVIKTNPQGIAKVNQETSFAILPHPQIQQSRQESQLVQIELTSIDALNEITANLDISRKEFDIASRSIKLTILFSVKFKDLQESWELVQFLKESDKLSEILETYTQIAINELENVKADLRKCYKQVEFPIILNLSSVGKTIAEIIASHL